MVYCLRSGNCSGNCSDSGRNSCTSICPPIAAMIKGEDPSFAVKFTTWLNFRSGGACLVWVDERELGGRDPVAPAGTNPPAQTCRG